MGDHLTNTRQALEQNGTLCTSTELYNATVAAKRGRTTWADWHGDHGVAVLDNDDNSATVLFYDSDQLSGYNIDNWADTLPVQGY